MATRGSMRTHLRRRLQEVSPAQWSDSALNDYLNVALQWVQQEVEAIDPEAVLYVDTADLVKGQAEYALPTNCKTPRRVRVKLDSGGDYVDIEERPLQETFGDWYTNMGTTNRPASMTVWALQGRFIKLDPTPGQSVTDGLELTYVPALTMGDDADVPEIDVDLHYGIVLMAQVIALADVDDSSARESALKEYALFAGRLQRHYYRSLAQQGGPTIRPSPRLKLGGDPTLFKTDTYLDPRGK